MENLRVRRAGFAYRRPYEGFLNRYKSLCPQTWPNPKGDPKSAVQTLVNHLKVFAYFINVFRMHFFYNTTVLKCQYGQDEYRMGETKIFIRLPKTLFETEDGKLIH